MPAKFVYENMKDWVLAKELAKRRMEEEDISPWMKTEREKYFNKLDDWKPVFLEENASRTDN